MLGVTYLKTFYPSSWLSGNASYRYSQGLGFESRRRCKIVISVGGGNPDETGFGRLVEARQPPFRTRLAITLRSPSVLRVSTPNGLEPLASTATVKLKIAE